MSTDDNNQAPATEETTGGEEGNTSNTISVDKAEYDKLLTDLGSLKRENKTLKRPKETTETSEKTNDTGNLLERVEKMALRSAGITHEDDVSLARETAKKWGVDIDELLDDEDFQAKLKRQQTTRKNNDATTNIKGDKGKGTSSAKETSEYWQARGERPTPDEVPDRKVRAKIIRELMAQEKGVGKNPYYNGK